MIVVSLFKAACVSIKKKVVAASAQTERSRLGQAGEL
jgi:hypothetical protein